MTENTAPASVEETDVEAVDDTVAAAATEQDGPEAADEPADGEASDAPADPEAADEPADGEASDAPADGEAADEPADGEASDGPADEADAVPTSRRAERVKQLEAEGDIAADYVEELLDIADLDGDIDMDVEGDRAAVSVVGSGLDALVGEEGQVLEALQELTRLAVYRETGERCRLMLDVGGYRADVRKNLLLLAQEAIEDVRETSESVKLAPMSPFERKVVHDAVAAAGLRSESEGVEPTRCVVILPSA